MSLFNPILDSDQYHASEVRIIGTLSGQPNSVTTGRDANIVEVDFEAAARRNIGYIRENIARRKRNNDRFWDGEKFVSWN